MSNAISVKIGDQLLSAELSDCPAAKQLLEALPLKLRMSRWGQEYYGGFGSAIEVQIAEEE